MQAANQWLANLKKIADHGEHTIMFSAVQLFQVPLTNYTQLAIASRRIIYNKSISY